MISQITLPPRHGKMRQIQVSELLVSTQSKPATNGTAFVSKISIWHTKGLNFNIIMLFNAIGRGKISLHMYLIYSSFHIGHGGG